ncbi:serine hydrolase domain-containing protein [Streptomyces sp. SID12488]|uniref:serine hydrolase domain-containing protein n=1 Tax=Streptomyces sp. SID12488 TaxID=2706040 RepID=UPI0013DC2862|nr:serine hydrolase domain-containing protein [Streptomyces sp. SID12488]NEA61281.1 beta-lactamase family protein [Streptomyces sp. SID12488]
MAVATAVAAGAFAAPAVAAPAERGGGHAATRDAMNAAVKDGVPGVALQAKDRHGVWKATAGVGNLRTKQPRSADDSFRAGSITKTFIATVLLQLEAEGRVSLDDTVDKWLPGVVRGNGHDGRRITLRQLLNHTSGIFNYTDDEQLQSEIFVPEGFFKNRYRTWTPDEIVKIAMGHKPEFTPGASWSYSNTNYTIAGMVIKKVTGNSYGDEVRRRVIKPLGLHGTYMPGANPSVPGPSSRAYSKLGENSTGKIYDVTEMNASVANSAGELISNPGDLNRFYSALLRGKVLPAEQLTEMKTTVAAGAVGGRYGLGLIENKLSCGVTVWGHSGGIHGSSSVAVTTADGKHSLAVNFNGDWSGDLLKVGEAEYCGTK